MKREGGPGEFSSWGCPLVRCSSAKCLERCGLTSQPQRAYQCPRVRFSFMHRKNTSTGCKSSLPTTVWTTHAVEAEMTDHPEIPPELENELMEQLRREDYFKINLHPKDRAGLEQQYGKVWDTEQLAQDFEVDGFAAPYVVVKRRADQVIGSLMFQHTPRFYFGWEPYESN